jgi:beta-galactosidase/beta-glucuronidase
VPRLLQDAQDMVLRDRNHASIVIWSLCTELGCTADQPGGGDIAVQFKQRVYEADNSRPVTGNTVQTPSEFMGLSAFYNTLNTANAQNAANVIQGGGAGNNNASLWPEP